MERQFTYQDFDLLIEPGLGGGSYRARVVRSPAGESAQVQFTLPFSAVELENFVLKIGQRRRGARGPGRPESAPLKEFGGKLYRAVFQDELRDALQRSLIQTQAQRVGLRLRLRLADTPELADVPWEFLYDHRRNRFLAQSRHTPLVRYLDLPDPPHPLSVKGPLRLLVMISSPSGYPALDVEQEWDALTGALAQQQAEGQVIIERLAANMSELRSRLRRQAFHVFHFIGHGFYHPEWHDGVLVMENRYGRPHEVTGEDLGGLLSEYDQTRLAVLNACEGARTGTSDPFAGMAQSLIQQGLPAVVAMQFEITDDAAIIFARELYAAIADNYPLEAALAEARGAIRDEGNPTEWGTPVLYSRAPDGHLFDMTKRIRPPEADRQAKEQADRQAREEADRQAKEQADRQAREEADRQAKEQPDRQAREEADRQAKEQPDRQAREEPQQQLPPLKFTDLLKSFFPTSRKPKRGADVEAEATISPIEAKDGATVRIQLTGEGPCETCRGTGAKPGTAPRRCPTCNGTGQAGEEGGIRPCQTCKGRGLVVDEPCSGCAGSGRMTMTRTINVRVPAGIKDGQRVRLQGRGAPGLNDGPNGDLYLRVHVAP